MTAVAALEEFGLTADAISRSFETVSYTHLMEEVLKPDEAEAAIEALLFTMGEAISAETLGAVIGHDKATVVRLVHRLSLIHI